MKRRRRKKKKKEISKNKTIIPFGLIYWIVVIGIGALLFNYFELGWLIFASVIIFHFIWTIFMDVKYNRWYC